MRTPGRDAHRGCSLALCARAVELVDDPVEAAAQVDAVRADGVRAGLLDPGPDPTPTRHLYEWLRRADEDGLEVLVAVPPAASGLGGAVRDRLRKAAGPR